MQRNESKIGDRTPWNTFFHPQANLKPPEASQNDVQRLPWRPEGPQETPRATRSLPKDAPNSPRAPRHSPWSTPKDHKNASWHPLPPQKGPPKLTNNVGKHHNMPKARNLVIHDVPAHRILRAQNETRFWDIAIYDVPAFARPRALQSSLFTNNQYFLHFVQAKI